ncbi:MAG: hypothetical protein ACYS8W_07740 [Planctomycetota bacterium]|jgi:hypothetical protein
MRGKIIIALTLVMAAASVVGCSTTLPTEPYAFEKATELLPNQEPFKRKIGVAPIRFRNSKIYLGQTDPEFYEVVDAEEAAIVKYNYDDKVSFRKNVVVPIFAAVFDQSLPISDAIEIFERKGGAKALTGNGKNGGENGNPLAGFGSGVSEQEILKGLLHECWKKGLDLLAVVTVTRHDIQYKGRNEMMFLNLFMWAYFFFPAWFIADEEYTYTFRAEVQLFPATRDDPGRPIFTSTVEYTKDLTLSQWAHGLNIARGIINPWWPSLGDRQVASIRDLVRHDFQREFAEKIANDFGVRYTRKESERAFQEEMKKRLAFIVGIDQHEGTDGFSTDIRGDAEYTRKRVGNFKPVVALTGREATRDKILKKLEEEILYRAGSDDKVLIYYSGIGASRKIGGKAYSYMLPYDFRVPTGPTVLPEDKNKKEDKSGKKETVPAYEWENALSVEKDVAALFANPRVRAERMLVILDTAFNGDSSRTRANVKTGLSVDEAPGAVLSKAYGKRKGLLFVLTATDDAAAVRQDASTLELGDSGSFGRFTYYLRKGLRPGQKQGFIAADLNEDKQVTVLELYVYIKKGVEQISQLEGALQAPTLWFNGCRYCEEDNVRKALRTSTPKPVTALTAAEFNILLRSGLDFTVFTYEINDRETDVDKKVILR